MPKDYPESNVGPGSPYTLKEWQERYKKLKDLAAEFRQHLNDEARQMCADAGLSPDLLGIHPHNAMCSYDRGEPWKNVDYNRVMICMDLMRIEFDAGKIVTAWDDAVRGKPHERWLKDITEAEEAESLEVPEAHTA